MDNHLLILQSSGSTEWWTPQPIIDAAREVLGGIDLDPASCAEANKRVRAARFFTCAADGLRQTWSGRIWLNHPFSREFNSAWVEKLVSEFREGNVISACSICFASTSERWFKPLLAFPQCFLSPRTNYLLPDGSVARGVTKGSVVTYFGRDRQRFVNIFAGGPRPLGVVKARCTPQPSLPVKSIEEAAL